MADNLTIVNPADYPPGLEVPEGAQVVKLDPLQQLQAENPGATIAGPRELDENTLFELSDKQQFNPSVWLQQNPDAMSDNALLSKLANVKARIDDRGFKLRDIAATPEDPEPSLLSGSWNIAKKAGGGLWDFAKGALQNVVNLGVAIPATVAAVVPGGVSPKQAFEATQSALAESGAAMESGAMGAIEAATTAGRKVGRFVTGENYSLQPDNIKLERLLNSVDREKLREDRIHARGPAMETFGGEVVRGLEQKGIGPEPERVAEMAGSDPLSLWMFGKIFQGGHALTAETITKPLQNIAAQAAKKATGWPTMAAGAAVERAAPVTAATIGAAKGAELGGPAGALIGGERGLAAGKRIARGARAVKEFGAEVAGSSPLESTAASGARAVIDAFPTFLKNTAAGAGMDIGFVAASSETPDEAGQMPLIGTAFGVGKGALSGARRFAISQQYSPDFWRRPDQWAQPYTPDNSFSLLANLHNQTVANAPDIQTARVNATHNFLQQRGADVPVYFVNDQPGLADALTQIYTRQGVPDAAERANFLSQQNGLFTENLVDDSGNVRRVVIARNPNSVPHEGFHGIQAVLGEAGNRPVDLLVFKAYEDVWEQEGNEHVARIVGPREFRALNEAGKWNWRDVLREKVGTDNPDVYLARELAAENFDYLFRAGIERPRGLPGRLADVILNLTDLFGTSPLQGERVPGPVPVEPRRQVVEALREQARRPLEPGTPPETPPSQQLPRTPSVPPITPSPEATRARAWVDEHPTGLPERDTAIRGLADATDQGNGVTVTYWAAKGEPAGSAASIRPERRAEIEAQRGAENADRQLVNKLLFPYRIDNTSKGPQFVGWSPDNFAANVGKLESWMGAVEQSKPGTVSRIPYEFDPATSKFTDAGRAALEADVKTFIDNQRAGLTGAGENLVVPPEVRARGYTQPERTGTPSVPLDQAKADLINYLFNIQLPETTTRVAPLHLAGQEISAATAPGRLVEPIRPRGEYSAAKLEKAGIPGPRRVLEVNPFRQFVESTSRETSVARPSLIEVSQRLNVPRIESIEPAPTGTPQFGGNVLTLAAGLQPREQLQPGNVTDEVARLKSFPSPTEFRAYMDGFTSEKFGKGLTGWAFDVGSRARTVEDVAALREAAELFSSAGREAMKAGDFDRAMGLMAQSQAAKEAFQAATGRNLEGQPASVTFIREHYDPNYNPPVPGTELKVAAQPSLTPEQRANRVASLKTLIDFPSLKVEARNLRD